MTKAQFESILKQHGLTENDCIINENFDTCSLEVLTFKKYKNIFEEIRYKYLPAYTGLEIVCIDTLLPYKKGVDNARKSIN